VAINSSENLKDGYSVNVNVDISIWKKIAYW